MKALFFLGLTLFGLSTSAFGLGTSPSIIERELPEDTTVTGALRVFTDQHGIAIQTCDWTIDFQGNSVVSRDKAFSGTWLSVPTACFKTDDTQGYIDLPYRITLPKSDIKESIANLTITQIATQNAPGINVAVAVGVPLYASVSRSGPLAATIEDMVYDKGELKAVVNNQSLVHIRPRVTVTLEKYTGMLWLEKLEPLPNKIEFTSYWPVLAKAKRLFTKRLPSLDPGRYVATFSMLYPQTFGQQDLVSTASAKFEIK